MINKNAITQKRQVINLIRQFFESQGFFEIETPLFVPSPGMEEHLHGFKTEYINHQGESETYYLPTSPEFAIKKALGSGFENVFEIARSFRNHGELGKLHHPEFNMLEWYRTDADYQDVMTDTENLIHFLVEHFPTHHYANFSWELPFKKRTIAQVFIDEVNIDLAKGLDDFSYWKRSAEERLGVQIPNDDTFDDIFFRLWIQCIEGKLGQTQPEIVYDYPAHMSALSKIKSDNPRWAERFELYIRGIEIGNAFSELTDSNEQESRFIHANLEREKMGYPPHPVDYELIRAVGKMKPTGGIAIGIERLLMVLTHTEDIREFFLFPMK
jgi:elongation factor P--(R)-beta-lysine ligase